MRLSVVPRVALVAVVAGAAVAASPAKKPSLLVSDLKPGHGQGTAPAGATGNGPWSTRIVLATSTDGLSFTSTGEVLTDQAGVPDLVVDPDKRLRCYYIDWPNGNVVAVAIQKAPHTWVYKRVRIKGALPKPPASDPVDPTVVLLPDKRYRLYYMQGAGGMGRQAIYSAISTDGVNFTREPGVRFTPPDGKVFDPMVLKTASGWSLWTGPDGAYSASSRDGLAFTSKGAFTVGGSRFMTWAATAAPGGGYRIFGNAVGARGQMSASAFSTDGTTWRLEPGTRLAGASDVGVAALGAGHWVMAYLVPIP